MPTNSPPPGGSLEFPGTSRYRIRRRLGAGAYGVVYEADDVEIGGRVALKVLHRPDGSALYRFKHEFRALAHLKHPNLVALHDLASEGGRWFFTMELVDGVDVVSFVCRGAVPASPLGEDSRGKDPLTTRSEVEDFLLTGPAARGRTGRDPARSSDVSGWRTRPLDLDRLRNAFGQLALGVAALHQAGKVHRDIKPSNILVERDGRVVLLDFGLVTEPSDPDGTSDLVVGTPAYMAPEQALGTVGASSDWYSVGCLLYLALTGRLPVVGSGSSDVLTRKQFEIPAPPRLAWPDVPPDLDELCMALLAREPQARPTDEEILRRLPARALTAPAPSISPARQDFVGRARELDELANAYRSMRDGRANVVTVRGRSGIGKTTLVRRFLDQAIRADRRAVALTGRCFERESVPYKALDPLVDSLRRYLAKLPRTEVEAVMPRNLYALARLFPVFRDLANAQDRRVEEIRDPLELRRRAFSALRELLARIADRAHLVLFIDDLQWGDADSIALLGVLLAPPDPPPLLLLLSYRSEDEAANPHLKSLVGVTTGAHLNRADIELGGLAEADARALVMHLLVQGHSVAEDADSILREAAGIPFMLVELASFLQHGGRPGDAAGPLDDRASRTAGSLVDAHVLARARLLEPDVRRLLETICVAGQPLSRATSSRAAGLEGERAQSAHEALDLARLTRSRVGTEGPEVEAFHDRVREAVTAGIAPDALVARHDAIAQALEAEPECDPERLSVHLCASGRTEEALEHVERAADRAAAALAFARAVRLYRLALDLSGREKPHALRRKLADSLANAGFGGEAGIAYLAAVEGASDGQALDLRRRAAEQFLRSGHVDEALPVVEAVLSEVGLRIPATPALSLASLLYQRAKLRIRGLGFVERADVPADELRKIDVCWALGNGMGGIDVIRGADFQARHLLLALHAGEPYRIARALSWEAILTAIEGGAAGHGRAGSISTEASIVAKRIGNQHGIAWSRAAEAITFFCLARWKPSRTASEEAIALFREHCADVGWEVGSMEMWWLLPAMRWLGDFAPFVERAAPCAREAVERGDLYTATGVRTHVLPYVHLMADRPDEALREGRDAIQEWMPERWLTHHWCNAVTQAHAALYAGRLGEALEGVERDSRRIQRSLQIRLETMRVQFVEVHARVLVAAAREDRARRESHLLRAERLAGHLMREDLPWARALGAVVRAGAAFARGNLDRARASYEEAARGFTELDMTVHALAVQARLGAIDGGETATRHRTECLAKIGERGVKQPERFAEALTP